MKHSDRHSPIPVILIWATPLLLSIPSIALAVMGKMDLWATLAQVLLPLGLTLMLMAAFKRTGLTALCLLPLMILAAFQIVLLFLYGDGSIIGVDMFLNVATTNPSEATELLDNLLGAIATVVALYLPLIILAITIAAKRMHPSPLSRKRAMTAATIVSALGIASLLMSFARVPHYRFDEDFYPANVMCNLGSAIERTHATARYHTQSAPYTFDARSQRSAAQRELYIAVIGETSRADNWQLFGYDRFTTPWLCSLPSDDICAFIHTMSESNTTHKSVPMLLSTVCAENFSRDINRSKSIITAFKEAGFNTAFLSMQQPNHSYIDFFGDEADTHRFLRHEPGDSIHDINILPAVDSIIALENTKQLIVVHMYGSHFNYCDRYPRQEAYFIPDITHNATAASRARLVNSYDNSIRHTDRTLAQLIARIDSIGCPGAMLYASDHGEDIYDDSRHRFLHASPTPTYMQLHVPMVLHLSPALRRMAPQLAINARTNSAKDVSSTASFAPTLAHIAGLRGEKLQPQRALTSSLYRPEPKRLFLNDRNRPETLAEAGFAHQDFDRMARPLAKAHSNH